jgi:hypothetical protein
MRRNLVPALSLLALLHIAPLAPAPAPAGAVPDLTVEGALTARGLWVDVRSFGARGDGVADDTAAIRAAIAAVPDGGTVLIPAGTFRVTGTGIGFTGKSYKSLTLKGAGTYRSKILGDRCQVIVDLGGSDHCTIEDLNIDSINESGIGLLLCRYAPAGPGGAHRFNRVAFTGSYAKALVYSVASEENLFSGCRFHTSSNVPCLYVSPNNDLEVVSSRGTIRNSTQTGPTVLSCTFAAYGTGEESAAIRVAGSVQHLLVEGCYVGTGGAAVRISGSPAIGPFVFRGNFFEASAPSFRGLHLKDARIYDLDFRGNLFSNFVGGKNPDIGQDDCTGSNALESSVIEDNRYSGSNRISLHTVAYSRIEEDRETVEIRKGAHFSTLVVAAVEWGRGASSYGTTLRKRVASALREQYGSLPSPTDSGGNHSTLAILPSKAPPASPEAGLLDVADGSSWRPWGPPSAAPVPVFFDGAGWRSLLPVAATPASSSSACARGTVAFDSGHVYVCVSDGNWRRAPLAAW